MDHNISSDIEQAIRLLQQGEVIAIPTETVYGLAANALNEEAINKIFLLKKRPQNNPLIVHTHSILAAREYVLHIPKEIELLMQTFCPGPITFLLPRKTNIPDAVTAKSDLVGIRIPRHALALDLLKRLSFPLAAPSANQYGYISPTRACDVNLAMQNEVALILDGGDCQVGIESTIVELNNGVLMIHRQGAITTEQIQQILHHTKVIVAEKNTNTTVTPGKSLQHYSPKTPFHLGDLNLLIPQYQHQTIGVISFGTSFMQQYQHAIQQEHILSTQHDPEEIAQKLYATLLHLDQQNVNVILCETLPNKGIGRAINDRLYRASYQHNKL